MQDLPEGIEFFTVSNVANLLKPVCDRVGPAFKFWRNGSFILEPFACGRVGDAKSPCVEHEAGGGEGLSRGFAINDIS